MSIPAEDRPLEVKVKNGRLVISIGIQTLAFVAVNNSAEDNHRGLDPTFLVSNPLKLAKDVAEEIEDASCEGDTHLHKLIGDAIIKAHEGGCTGIVTTEESKKVAARCKDWDVQAHDAHLVTPRQKSKRRRKR